MHSGLFLCRVECVLRGSSDTDPNGANWSCDLAMHLLLQEVPNMLGRSLCAKKTLRWGDGQLRAFFAWVYLTASLVD